MIYRSVTKLEGDIKQVVQKGLALPVVIAARGMC